MIGDPGWSVDNRTNDTLCVYFAVGFKTAYPDTTFPTYADYTLWEVDPHQNISMPHMAVSGEKIFKGLPKDTLSVFIVNNDTINKYSWDGIRENYNILIRYDLSLKNLKNLKYTIPYPPTDAMRDMKMYPPYGE
jgi:hypothetical protein